MESKKRSTSFEKKKDFLLTVLGAEEKRRDAVENKSSILIASNAILLSAMIGFALPLNSVGNPVFLPQLFLTVVVFASVILSIYFSTLIIATPPRRDLLNIGLNPQETNLFWFQRIAQYKKSEYQDEINGLTDQEIIYQLSSQTYSLARLLVSRYKNFRRAYNALLVGIFAFALLSITKLF